MKKPPEVTTLPQTVRAAPDTVITVLCGAANSPEIIIAQLFRAVNLFEDFSSVA